MKKANYQRIKESLLNEIGQTSFDESTLWNLVTAIESTSTHGTIIGVSQGHTDMVVLLDENNQETSFREVQILNLEDLFQIVHQIRPK